jgi:hypothetical protein
METFRRKRKGKWKRKARKVDALKWIAVALLGAFLLVGAVLWWETGTEQIATPPAAEGE